MTVGTQNDINAYYYKADRSLADRVTELTVQYKAEIKKFVDAATGRSLTKQQTINILNSGITESFNSLDTLVTSLFNGTIELDQFAIGAADQLRDMAVYRAMIAKGGTENLDKKDLKIVSSFLKNSFVDGTLIDRDVNDRGTVVRTKKSFGLNQFVQDLAKGEETEIGARDRIRLYGESTRQIDSKITTAAKVENGNTEVLNILNKTKGTGTNHAKICIAATSQGWMKIEEMITKFGEPPRHVKCLCDFVYR